MPLRLEAPDGRLRSAHVVLPRNWFQLTPLPVVLLFHGGESGAQDFAAVTRMHEICHDGRDENQFVAVYLEAWSVFQAESTGGTWGISFVEGEGFALDEAGFVRTVLDFLQDRLTRTLGGRWGVAGKEALDRDRVYGVGFSEGAMLTYQMVVQLPPAWSLRAVCVASGTIGGQVDALSPLLVNDPAGTSPASILMVHSVADPTVLYLGGTLFPDSLVTGRGLALPGPTDPPLPFMGQILPFSIATDLWIASLGGTPLGAPTDPSRYLAAFDNYIGVSTNGTDVVAVGLTNVDGHNWPTPYSSEFASMIWEFFKAPLTFV